jgi:hypothetical protein
MPLRFFITITYQTGITPTLRTETSDLKAKQAIERILLQHPSDKRQALSLNKWYAKVPAGDIVPKIIFLFKSV